MARLGDVCTVVSGTTPKSNHSGYWDGNLNWVTPAELTDESDTIYETQRKITSQAVIDSSLKSFPAGTVLLSSRAPIGKVAIAGTEMYCNQGFKNLICSEKIYNRYLYHFLKNKTAYLNSLGRGATFKEISKSIVENIEIPLPSLEEQREIAAVLDKVSELIAKRRQQLDKLDLLEKARFVEIFCNPIENANWEFVNMADISTDMRTGPFGSALRHNEFVEIGIFVLGIDNAVENRFTYNRMRYITEEKYEQLKRYTVRPGDVIITIMGTVGRSAVIPDNIPKAINTKHLACLTINRSKAQPMFVCCAFQMHPEIRQQLTGQAKGAIMDGLNLTIIKKLSFKLPPLEIQNEFVKFFGATEKTKTIIEESLMKLETIKKALMQEYFG